jgi:octaprenyl-diphosphate synthase
VSLPLEASRIDPSAPQTGSALDPARFLDLIAPKLIATEELFRRHLGSDVPFISEAGSYLFNGGGKRMRPALLLLSSRLLGHDGDEEITYAAVVELIHTATLVHDDIIDDARLRRGQPTVDSVWDNSRAVLLGDWLYTTSMQLALRHGRIEVIRRLCDATLRMTEGELLVLDRLGALDIDAEEYFDIIDRKTARLFAAASSIPALIPPATDEQRQALETYGRSLGLCFQLVDDLLDFTASEDDLGKPVLSDLKGGKLTLPLILLLPRLDPRRLNLIGRVLEDRSFDHVEPGEILEAVTAEGTLEEVQELASRHARKAIEALTIFPASDAREALEFAPEFVLNRRS